MEPTEPMTTATTEHQAAPLASGGETPFTERDLELFARALTRFKAERRVRDLFLVQARSPFQQFFKKLRKAATLANGVNGRAR